MSEPSIMTAMIEQDRQIAAVIAKERSRLRHFIGKRVPDPADVEDLLQEVFCELVEANRLLMPIDHVTGWLFRVARNRIIDLFRKKRPQSFSDTAVGEDGETPQIERSVALARCRPGRALPPPPASRGVEICPQRVAGRAEGSIYRPRTGGAQL